MEVASSMPFGMVRLHGGPADGLAVDEPDADELHVQLGGRALYVYERSGSRWTYRRTIVEPETGRGWA